ncbi:MAG: hypothetical protein ACOYYS_10745 [Chloroflexota bacterium]
MYSLSGLAIHFAGKLNIHDNGGLIIVLLIPSIILIDLLVVRFDRYSKGLLAASAIGLVLIASYIVLKRQSYLSFGHYINVNELNKVLYGSLFVSIAAILSCCCAHQSPSMKTSPPRLARFCKWVFVNSVGMLLGVFCGAVVVNITYAAPGFLRLSGTMQLWGGRLLLPMLFGLLLGGILGLLQEATQTRDLKRILLFSGAAAIGWGAAWGCSELLFPEIDAWGLVNWPRFHYAALDNYYVFESFMKDINGAPIVYFSLAFLFATILQSRGVSKDHSSSSRVWRFVVNVFNGVVVGLVWEAFQFNILVLAYLSGIASGLITGLAMWKVPCMTN